MRDQLENIVFASFYRKLVLAREYLDSWEKLFPLIIKALPIRLNRNRMQSIHFRFRNQDLRSICLNVNVKLN